MCHEIHLFYYLLIKMSLTSSVIPEFISYIQFEEFGKDLSTVELIFKESLKKLDEEILNRTDMIVAENFPCYGKAVELKQKDLDALKAVADDLWPIHNNDDSSDEDTSHRSHMQDLHINALFLFQW